MVLYNAYNREPQTWFCVIRQISRISKSGVFKGGISPSGLSPLALYADYPFIIRSYAIYIGQEKPPDGIIETKGGFTKSGSSEDIDRFTAKKFGVLRKYLDGYNLQGGIVRQDKQSGELCICVDKYSDNIHDENWQLLSEVL